MQEIYERIKNHPDFRNLVKLRRKISWILTSIVILFYFIFILIIAFSPNTFSRTVFPDNATTLGIIIGLFIILLSIFLTGIYVYLANKKLDKINDKIIKIINK